MNNINRRQQIPVAFNTEKSMTYGSALQASARRDNALSNLNRMSNATNPWVRKVAQGALSNDWVDYQNQLVEQASGTGPQQEYYREALGQIRNQARATSMGERLTQAVQTEEARGGWRELLSNDFYEQGFGEGESQGSAPSQDSAFLYADVFEEGGMTESEFQQRSREAVASRARVGGISTRELYRQEVEGFEPVELEAQYGVPSGLAEYRTGGEEALGSRTSARMELISPAMFEEAVRQQRAMEQRTLQGMNPLQFINLFTQDVKSEVQNLGEYEREALEQGVEQDFQQPDITLRRRKNRFADIRSQQQQTFGNPVSTMFQVQDFQRGYDFNEMGRRAGLPDFESLASGAGEAGGVALGGSLTMDQLIERGFLEVPEEDRSDFEFFLNRYPSYNKERALKGFSFERQGSVQGSTYQGNQGFEGGGKFRSVNPQTFSLFD